MAFRTQRKAGMPAGIVNLIDLSGTEPNPVFSAPWSSIRFDPPPTDIYPRDRLIQFRKAAYRRSKILRARKKPNP